MIIKCAKCGKQNRVSETTSQTGSFHCGFCGYEIATFTARQDDSPPSQNQPFRTDKLSNTDAKTKRGAGLLSGYALGVSVGIFALCLIFAVFSFFKTPEAAQKSTDTVVASPSVPVKTMPYVQATPNTQPTPFQEIPTQLTPVHEDFSLPNGTDLTHHHRNRKGKGSIEISNGTDRDAEVKLITPASRSSSSAHSYCTVYVKAGNSTTISHVRPDTYEVKFCAGRDWDKTKEKFLNSVSY